MEDKAQNKRCSRCGEVGGKDGCGFYKNKNTKDGYKSICKICVSKKRKEDRLNNLKKYHKAEKTYRLANREKLRTYKRKWRKANPEKCRKAIKKYRSNNPEKSREDAKKWRDANLKKRHEAYKNWQKNNLEKRRKYMKEWRKVNRERCREINKKWRDANRKKYQEYRREYCYKRRENPIIRLNHAISRNIRQSLKSGKGGNHWENLVGWTLQQLKNRFVQLFQPGMTWKNYGEWHIEHKIPKSAFNFSKPEHADFKRCWALENLQPMWAFDNLSKHIKLEKAFQPCLLL